MENNWAAHHMFAAAAAASCSSFPSSSSQHLVDTALGGAHGPHITCLKLGKRQYYAGDAVAAGAIKRDRPSSSSSSSSSALTHVIPACQVEGCSMSLMDAKDYHKRHKVCEMHSKAPKVVVLGSEQRFCQQCSRFHAISEFDDSKRSCRRRLAGHNERRRKSNSSDSTISRNPIPTLETTMMASRYPYLSETLPGCALSLLSSKDSPWIPISSHSSSAALHELIVETRAALLAKQLFSNGGDMCYNNQSNIISFVAPHQNNQEEGIARPLSGRFPDSGSDHLTLDLMQSNNSASFTWD